MTESTCSTDIHIQAPVKLNQSFVPSPCETSWSRRRDRCRIAATASQPHPAPYQLTPPTGRPLEMRCLEIFQETSSNNRVFGLHVSSARAHFSATLGTFCERDRRVNYQHWSNLSALQSMQTRPVAHFVDTDRIAEYSIEISS